jgi:long-chain-fatty-acid--[acyl-carrier-protein] ligase
MRIIDSILITFAKLLLSLRYRIKISGIEAIAAKDKKGILFLPNHPALIDPIILFAYMHPLFVPSAIADKDQVDRFLIRRLVRRFGIRTIPDITKYGSSARDEIEKTLDAAIEGLKSGENLLLWPAGHIYRSCLENLSSNSSIERVIRQCPNVRIVLIRTRGLWGSRFSRSSGRQPKVAEALVKGLFSLLTSAIFFAPRRNVTIDFYEPADLPRTPGRNVINRLIEAYYNVDAPPNTYVPYTIWEKPGPVTLPEPASATLRSTGASIPPAARQTVLNYLSQLTGISHPRDSDRLSSDLGMDSLARVDLTLWLEKEFGFPQANVDAIQTVSDVMLAACGQFVYSGPADLKPIGSRWFQDTGSERVTLPEGNSVPQLFLKQAALSPSKIIIADQATGSKSFRDLVAACLVLKRPIENLEGDRLGIMMPASVAADVLYLAALFAGKTPVMVNWTAGPRNILESLNLTEVKNVLTSKTLVQKISSQGIDLSEISDRFVFIETLARSISAFAKFKAFLSAHFSWAALYKARISPLAAIIFTSGSETLPKAVPLTHNNVLSNLRDVVKAVTVRQTDRLIGFLPPFHSFGLTCTILVPLCAGVRTVYHPNPMDAGLIARIIEAYRVTLLIGTPTFLNGIVRTAEKNQLSPLRLAVTGAERCSENTYALLKQRCANAVILEGYGVTECSPIISLADENNPQPFTIGKVLPSLQYLLTDPQTGRPLDGPGTGILLVKGLSVFAGYLSYTGPSPFLEIGGHHWYSTGDIVSVDERQVFTFRGRLKRFVKLGGEMISLPAIEAVLEQHYPAGSDKGPVLAVEATEDEHPELVLFTTLDIEREQVNRCIRQAGLSGLHNIRRVIKLPEIPLLGTGKPNYRALKDLLRATS